MSICLKVRERPDYKWLDIYIGENVLVRVYQERLGNGRLEGVSIWKAGDWCVRLLPENVGQLTNFLLDTEKEKLTISYEDSAWSSAADYPEALGGATRVGGVVRLYPRSHLDPISLTAEEATAVGRALLLYAEESVHEATASGGKET